MESRFSSLERGQAEILARLAEVQSILADHGRRLDKLESERLSWILLKTEWKASWVRVVNSHQPGRPWCPPGTFLVALDLDGPRNLDAHDSPVVGQAMCAGLAGTADAWAEALWKGRRLGKD